MSTRRRDEADRIEDRVILAVSVIVALFIIVRIFA